MRSGSRRATGHTGGRPVMAAVGLALMALGSLAPVAVASASTGGAATAGKATGGIVPGFAFSTDAITCPTATTCLAGASNSTTGGQVVVINGANGAPTTAGTDEDADPLDGIGCA